MLSKSLAARREQGYTLVELVVVMGLTGIVISALVTIMVVTLQSSTRTLTRVDATQHARLTIENILNEMHSSCLASGATPIQAGSSGTSLVVDYAYGSAIPPTAVQHQITFNAAAGTLVDTTSAGSKTLLTNVTASGGTPVFQYYAYQEPTNSQGVAYTDAQGNPYMMLLDGTTALPGTSTIPPAQPLTAPLSTSQAASAAEVVITLAVGPTNVVGEDTKLNDARVTVSDSTVLRLTPVGNNANDGSGFEPCQ